MPWLPGGRNCVKSVIRSNRLVLPPIRLVASATAISRAGKNARKRLKAIACEIMLHRGNTLANVRYARRRSLATGFITGHYTCPAPTPCDSARQLRAHGPHRPVPRINACGTMLPQQSPARGHNGRLVLSSQGRRSEVASEGHAVVEQEGHAVIGMSRRVQDFAHNANPAEHRAALGE